MEDDAYSCRSGASMLLPDNNDININLSSLTLVVAKCKESQLPTLEICRGNYLNTFRPRHVCPWFSSFQSPQY